MKRTLRLCFLFPSFDIMENAALHMYLEIQLIICCTFIKSMLLFVVITSLPQIAQIVH